MRTKRSFNALVISLSFFDTVNYRGIYHSSTVMSRDITWLPVVGRLKSPAALNKLEEMESIQDTEEDEDTPLQ